MSQGFKETLLPKKDEQEVFRRIEAYEKGQVKTISGSNFSEELRKKYRN